MNTLTPETFSEALLRHKPMKRSRLVSKTSLSRSKRSKRPRKKSVSTLKRAAWTQFSIWIRTRGADSQGMNTCVTCGVKKHWKELQAGHFIAGRGNAVLFSEQGVWPQCYGCNCGRNGSHVDYFIWMEDHFGREVIAELMLARNQTHKWLPGELVEIAAHYKALNEANPLIGESK